MTKHSIAPGYVKWLYEGTKIPHHQVVPIRFSGTPVPGTVPTLLTRSGGTLPWADFVDVHSGILAGFLDNDLHITGVEVHTYDEITETDEFIYGQTLNVAGTIDTDAALPAGELTVSFKTQFGNIYRWYVMEPAAPVGINSVSSSTVVGVSALLSYLLSADCPVYGRDGNPIFAHIRSRTKTNDKLRAAMGL